MTAFWMHAHSLSVLLSIDPLFRHKSLMHTHQGMEPMAGIEPRALRRILSTQARRPHSGLRCPHTTCLGLFLALVSWCRLIEILLEAGEDLADFFGVAEVGDGVGDGVVVFEAEQGG